MIDQEIEILSGAYGSGAVPMRFVERVEKAVIPFSGGKFEDEPRKVYGSRHWFMDCQHCNATRTHCEACLQRQAKFDQWASKREALEGRANFLMLQAKRGLPKVPAKAKGIAQAYADLISKLWVKPEVQEWRDAVKACWEVTA